MWGQSQANVGGDLLISTICNRPMTVAHPYLARLFPIVWLFLKRNRLCRFDR